jgi:molybdenum cofactor biosynthesis enzyme MoaA
MTDAILDAVPVRVRWHETGMRSSLSVEVAVVRSAKPRKCEACQRKRVLFAQTFTIGLLGNPEHPWRCAPCWRLR